MAVSPHPTFLTKGPVSPCLSHARPHPAEVGLRIGYSTTPPGRLATTALLHGLPPKGAAVLILRSITRYKSNKLDNVHYTRCISPQSQMPLKILHYNYSELIWISLQYSLLHNSSSYYIIFLIYYYILGTFYYIRSNTLAQTSVVTSERLQLSF